MRIALCFSGQPRAFEKSYPYYKKNLIDPYRKFGHEVHVFCHTWYNDDNGNMDQFKLFDRLEEMYSTECIECEIEWRRERFQHLKCIDPVKHPSTFTVSAFYSMWKSCELKTRYELNNGVAFDWVIRTRFDYALNRMLPLGEADPNKIYIPNCRQVPTRDFGNDQFAFGSSKVMNDYMSTYLYLPVYYAQGVPMNGEDMMSTNLKRTGLVGENLIYVDMNNPFPPGPYNGTPHSLIREDMDKWVK